MADTDEARLTGGCLCGAIRFEITGALSDIWTCHCSKCRKARGSAFHAGAMCRAADLRMLSGDDAITAYDAPSGYPTRFCRHCGSPAPLVFEQGGYAIVFAGTLDGATGKRLLHHIHVASKADWYEIHDDRPQHAEGFPGIEGMSERPR